MPAQPERGRVRGVERPVAVAVVVQVVGVRGRVLDAAVGVARVDPGQVLRGRAAAPVLDDHLGGRGAAQGLAALVHVLRVARHGQLDTARGTGRAGGHGERVGNRGGHGAGHEQRRGGRRARRPVERHAELDVAQRLALGCHERVHVDPAVLVGLAGHAGAPDVGVAGGPAAHGVPAGARAAQVDLEPRPRWGEGVPRRDDLRRAEPGGVPRRRPAGELVPALGTRGRADDQALPGGRARQPLGTALGELGGGAPFAVVDLRVRGDRHRHDHRRAHQQDTEHVHPTTSRCRFPR